MQDVAHDHDTLAAQIAQRVTERVRVEEALCRMGMPAVAGVDHRGVGPFGDEVRCAG